MKAVALILMLCLLITFGGFVYYNDLAEYKTNHALWDYIK